MADFGLSVKYESAQLKAREDRCGTLIFMGPEILLKSLYSRSVDVFATGVIMYMLLTGGSHPLYDSRTFQVEKYKRELLMLKEFPFPENHSALARSLFHGLTRFNSSERYSATRALEHPWITRLNKTTIPKTLNETVD